MVIGKSNFKWMRRVCGRWSLGVVAMALPVLCAPSSLRAGSVEFDWAVIGNPGNAPDPLNITQVAPMIGRVDYVYRIATTEVTNAQYAAFLNAVDPNGVNPNAIYHNFMGQFVVGGITLTPGAPAGDKYRLKPSMSDKPINYVNFRSAMRFINWLHNGQGAGGTESGAYTVGDGSTEVRSANARFFLPSENEWYKAAYHHPAADGGDSDDYWLYPTRTNVHPIPATANAVGDISNPGFNVTNHLGQANWNGTGSGNVTTVGSAGPLSRSYYGTYDQGGNVWEWIERLSITQDRQSRGGSWRPFEDFQDSSRFQLADPGRISSGIGFRVASPIPEPSSLSLVLMGAVVLLRRRCGMRGGARSLT